jgi:hypothetical protein
MLTRRLRCAAGLANVLDRAGRAVLRLTLPRLANAASQPCAAGGGTFGRSWPAVALRCPVTWPKRCGPLPALAGLTRHLPAAQLPGLARRGAGLAAPAPGPCQAARGGLADAQRRTLVAALPTDLASVADIPLD